MSKEENVVRYYVLCNKLKNLIRSGWKNWNVKRERIESVAEHIYGVQMLAIAMYSQYQYDIDIFKVIYMLAIHELEEIYIGDLTMFEIDTKKKEEIGHNAVSLILKDLLDKDKIINIILEFDKKETKEAQFAYFCDKLECDIQARIYDLENCVDLDSQNGNIALNNNLVKDLLTQGKSWSEMWLEFGQYNYKYDDNFLSVSNYVKNNNINELYTK